MGTYTVYFGIRGNALGKLDCIIWDSCAYEAIFPLWTEPGVFSTTGTDPFGPEVIWYAIGRRLTNTTGDDMPYPSISNI